MRTLYGNLAGRARVRRSDPGPLPGGGPATGTIKVEADWAGERRTLAVSLTAERPRGQVLRRLVAEAAALPDVKP